MVWGSSQRPDGSDFGVHTALGGAGALRRGPRPALVWEGCPGRATGVCVLLWAGVLPGRRLALQLIPPDAGRLGG